MSQKIKNDAESAELKNQLHDSTKQMVLSMLTTYPQDRFVLAAAIGISEREFRSAIRELRRDGHLIITESSVNGYRLGTKKEALITAREFRSRAYDLLKTARALEGGDPNQITLVEFFKGDRT